MIRGVGLVGLCWLTACHSLEPHELARAQGTLRAGNLVRTLVLLDRIPPSDPDYPEARALAYAVERRLRTSQKLFGTGLRLRAEWRDEEALRYFEMAREVWPRVAGAAEMIRATRSRMAMISQRAAAGEPAGGEEAETRPTDPVFGTSGGDSEVTDPAVDNAPPAAPIGESAPPPDPVQLGLVSAKLQRAEALLGRAQLEEALDLLEALHAESSGDPRVGRTLIRVLHQRALLHYGQGHLQLALIDWASILRLDPGHEQAREFSAAAETELRTMRRSR